MSNEELAIKLRNELEKRKAESKFSFFQPNGKQEEFIRLFGSGGRFISIFSTANGLGKTALLVNILGNLAYGSQSKFFDLPLFKNWPYAKRARFITDPELVKDIGPLNTEINEWWPKGKFVSAKEGKGYNSIFHVNGWLIDVMTSEQDVKQFEGGNIPLIIFDEPPKEDIWNACISRMRKGGLILVFMTPLTSSAWFFDKVVPKHQDAIIYGDIEDACKVHGIRGHLEHSHIEKMIANMPQEEVDARIHGKAMHMKGRIYKGFDQSVHVLPEDKWALPKVGSTVYQIVDPHVGKPFAVIWGFPEADGTLHVFDEWPNQEFTEMDDPNLSFKDANSKDDYAYIFREKEKKFKVNKRIIDRHFADVRNAITRKTLRESIREQTGIHYEPSYSSENEIDTGVLQVRTKLKWNKDKPLDNMNRPKLLINSNCKNTIKSFQMWALDPKKGTYQEKYKDFADVVRYFVMANPKVSAPWPRQEFKKRWG